jgi:alginate O-acetyltransferase complex protein AlgI
MYNGLVLMLDRMFLLRVLERTGAIVATAVTLLIVMIGWVIFRSTSIGQIGGYMTALLGMQSGSAPIAIQGDVPFVAAVGVVLSLLPATPLYGPLRQVYERSTIVRGAGAIGLVILFGVAVARAISVPFMPFIYFRF